MTPHCEEVIISTVLRGDGTPKDPRRTVTQIHSKDGELIAEQDSIQEDASLALEGELRELAIALSIEHKLRLGRKPWVCKEEDCCSFEKPATPYCMCFREMEGEHTKHVASLLRHYGAVNDSVR